MKAICGLLLLCSSLSFSQYSEALKPDIPSFSPVMFEAVAYKCEDTSSIQLIILYRLNPRFFFFAKDITSQQETYIAKGDLVVEILDENGVTIARDFRPIQIQQNSSPNEGINPFDDLQGAFTFKIKNGIYKIVIEAKDSESNKSFINRDTKVGSQTKLSSALSISSIIFIEPSFPEKAAIGQEHIFPLNRGGNVLIGEKSSCMFQVASEDTNTELKLSWKLISKENDGTAELQTNLSGELFYLKTGAPTVESASKGIALTVDNSSPHNRILTVPIPTERLETGKYLLTITVAQGVQKTEKEFPFNIIWPQKPLSLVNFRIAVNSLRHIAAEEDLNQMNAFSSAKSIKAFRDFWKKRSPDTTRAFNPAMAEYYRRVDETIKRFSTENERDGYFTDRGRIYILFGAPSITNRLLKPNSSPTEIWTYEKLKRRFTFSDKRKNGNYILIKTENY